MYEHLRPFLFRLDPERAHTLTIHLLKIAGRFPVAGWLLKRIFDAPALPVRAFGIEFQNPIGLAAGYDKDGLGWRGLAYLGFGHIEVGTVTLKPQPGNPKPRLFRLVEDQALINRMGFPGKGAEFVAARLRGRKRTDLVLGVNIGKNKDTPLEQSGDEYAGLINEFSSLADYIAINVSSPNTLGLRRLQARNELSNLLSQLSRTRQSLANQVPILVKLAPDLAGQELEDAVDIILSTRMDGVIVVNTTLERQNLHSRMANETGGLSGMPLKRKSLAMVEQVVKISNGKLPVIGVGGIMQPADAQQMLDQGAVLVQIYSGLVYSGPGLAANIIRSLAA